MLIPRNHIKWRIKTTITSSYMALYSVFCRLQNKVLFESFGGKQYSDNPRAISEKLHKEHPEIEIVWALKDTTDQYGIIPPYVRIVKRKSVDYYKQLSTSVCYVTNCQIGPNIRKRKHQYFVQTWHGDRVFKKVLYDAWLGRRRPIYIIDGKVTDICVAASDVGEAVYRSAFKYYGEVLRVGMPRNDCLVNYDDGRKEKIRNLLSIPEDHKVLLFAPTFRDHIKGKQSVGVDLRSVLALLRDSGNKWVCLLRKHSGSAGLDFEFDQKEFVDVSDYPDMADLLCIADMLITDYSSSAGDFVLTGKPVILAIFDREQYEAECRQFNIEPETSGFLTASNQKELEDILSKTSVQDYKENCQVVMNNLNINETGRASEIICDRIWNHLTTVFDKRR